MAHAYLWVESREAQGEGEKVEGEGKVAGRNPERIDMLLRGTNKWIDSSEDSAGKMPDARDSSSSLDVLAKILDRGLWAKRKGSAVTAKIGNNVRKPRSRCTIASAAPRSHPAEEAHRSDTDLIPHCVERETERESQKQDVTVKPCIIVQAQVPLPVLSRPLQRDPSLCPVCRYCLNKSAAVPSTYQLQIPAHTQTKAHTRSCVACLPGLSGEEREGRAPCISPKKTGSTAGQRLCSCFTVTPYGTKPAHCISPSASASAPRPCLCALQTETMLQAGTCRTLVLYRFK